VGYLKDPNKLIGVSEIGFSDLDIIWALGIGIWDFSTVSGKENHFLLNQLELTLTLPCFSYHLC